MADATYVHGTQDKIDYTPTSATDAGTVIVQGDLVGITNLDIEADRLGALSISGVWDITKDTSTAHTVGQKVYWDDTNKKLTTTASGNKRIGTVLEAADAAAETARVLLVTV